MTLSPPLKPVSSLSEGSERPLSSPLLSRLNCLSPYLPGRARETIGRPSYNSWRRVRFPSPIMSKAAREELLILGEGVLSAGIWTQKVRMARALAHRTRTV